MKYFLFFCGTFFISCSQQNPELAHDGFIIRVKAGSLKSFLQKNPGKVLNESLGLLQLNEKPDSSLVEYMVPNYIIQLPMPLVTNAEIEPKHIQILQNAEIDEAYRLQSTQGGADPLLEDQWNLKAVNFRGEANPRISEVIVAVIDTGVDYNHPDLNRSIYINTNEIPGNGIDDDNNNFIDDYTGFDFADMDPMPFDQVYLNWQINAFNPGHGTHCAGVVGAIGGNGTGISSLASGVKIMPLRVFAKGGAALGNFIQAITYAADMGAHVLSNSWGTGFQQIDSSVGLVFRDLIQYANDKGSFTVFAAGNGRKDVSGNVAGINLDNQTFTVLPAAIEMPGSVTVAAITNVFRLSYFSNFGIQKVQVAAPGSVILSTVPRSQSTLFADAFQFSDRQGNTKIAPWSGTSMATPLVASLAARLIAEKSLSVQDLKQELIRTSRGVSELAGVIASGGVVQAP